MDAQGTMRLMSHTPPRWRLARYCPSPGVCSCLR